MDAEQDDTRVIGECLLAAADGPFFPDWEFHILFGLERDEVREVARAWPTTDDPERQRNAVNGSLNMLLGYPHARWDAWTNFISVPPDEVARVYARWRGEDRLDESSEGFFDRLT
jgi:hypothetical protein